MLTGPYHGTPNAPIHLEKSVLSHFALWTDLHLQQVIFYLPRRGHIYFASYLARTVRHCTIKIYLAAVRNLRIVSGYNDPLQGKLLLPKILQGILRYQGCSHKSRQPVTLWVLLAIRTVLESWLDVWDFFMIWTAFNPAFFAFLCCSEFTYPGARNFSSQFNLTTGCVNFSPSLARPQHMLLNLNRLKLTVLDRGNLSCQFGALLYCALFPLCNSIVCLPSLGLGPFLLSAGSASHSFLCYAFTSGFCLLCGTPIWESKRSQFSYSRCICCGRYRLTRLVNKSFRSLVLGLLSSVYYSHSWNSLAFCCSQNGSRVREVYLVFCCCLGGCIACICAG